MTQLGYIKTALFVPGNRPDRIDKAFGTPADAVIMDLEDAVPVSRKAEARRTVREKIGRYKEKTVFVRVNPVGSEWIEKDLDEMVTEGLDGIIFPKVDDPSHVREINRLITERERNNSLPLGAIAMIPLVESAAAVQNAYLIASEKTTPQRRYTLAFGAADYTLDMGITMTRQGDELLYPRSRIALACRAAGIIPPVDTPFMIDLKDQDALKEDTRRAKGLGFYGKMCIHPDQIPVINRIFLPTEEEVEYARRVIKAFEDAEAAGNAAIQLDGKFIDRPIVEQARRTLQSVSS